MYTYVAALNVPVNHQAYNSEKVNIYHQSDILKKIFTCMKITLVLYQTSLNTFCNIINNHSKLFCHY